MGQTIDDMSRFHREILMADRKQYYRDFREHLQALEERGKLVRINREINKDTELMPLVRWQFRGLEERDRKAFIFENVDRFQGPSLFDAGHRRDFGRDHRDLRHRHDVRTGRKSTSAGRRRSFIPSNLSKSRARRCKRWFGRDKRFTERPWSRYAARADFDARFRQRALSNLGELDHQRSGNRYLQHRQLSKPDQIARPHRRFVHLPAYGPALAQSAKPRAKRLEACIAIGVVPSIAYSATAKIPYDFDEYRLAGGLAGEPVEVVQAKTVDLLVPATAEIIIEGTIPTDIVEPEGPFGEYPGYMGHRSVSPFLEVTCITHRRDAIYTALMSQFPPSESSKIKHTGTEKIIYKLLRHDSGNSAVLDVALHDEVSGSGQAYCVIKMRNASKAEAWRALQRHRRLYRQLRQGLRRGG